MSLRHIHLSASQRRLPTRHPAKICNTVSSLLRHAELTMRRDGYVCVEDLLRHPKLNGVTFLTLEDIIKKDKRQNLHLLYEPRHPATSWWIRANQGRESEHVETDMRRTLNANEITTAVHGTSIEAWKSIVKQGLSRMDRNYIHLAQGERGASITNGIIDSSQVFIYIDVAKAMQAGIKFYLSSNGVVLTDGNENGFLGPSYFKNVEMIKIKTDQLTTSVPHASEEQDPEGILRELAQQ